MYIKVCKVVSPNCFIGLRGSEDEIRSCTTCLRTTPYEFTQITPKSVKSGQEVVCLSSAVGWARGEIINRVDENRFEVRLIDYFADEHGSDIVETIRWESIKLLPRRFTTLKIPPLAGVFYLVDPGEPKFSCGFVVDESRTEHLLTQMAECEDEVFRCEEKALSPMSSVVTVYLDFPLSGFFNGKVHVPYFRPDVSRRTNAQSDWTPQLSDDKLSEFNRLKEMAIFAEDPGTRALILDEMTNLLSQKLSLEQLELSSDDNEDLSEPTSASHPGDSGSSPYRKEKESRVNASPSRKQRQAMKKKQRNRARNVLIDDSASTSGASSAVNAGDSAVGEQSISEMSSPGRKQDPRNVIPAGFMNSRFHFCNSCGYVREDHICQFNDSNQRSLADMWNRDSD